MTPALEVTDETSEANRRCKPKPRAFDPRGLRPTDFLTVFFAAAMLYLVAGVIVGGLNVFAGIANGRWLALHLIFLGGLSQLVLGASQFFAGAFLATDPPSRIVIRLQFALWNLGTLAIVFGGPFGGAGLTGAGALALAVGLVCFVWGMLQLRRKSLQRMPWSQRWYWAATGFLLTGIVVGDLLSHGGDLYSAKLLSAHMTLNVMGWFGTAIVGTLHTFFPSLCGTGPWPVRRQQVTYVLWVAGIALTAAAFALGVNAFVLAGIGLLLLATVIVLANVVDSLRRAGKKLETPAILVSCGQLCLWAGLVLAAIALPTRDYVLTEDLRSALGTVLIGGWIGLTVAGSLIRLLGVAAFVRGPMRVHPDTRIPLAGFVVALALASVAALAAAALGIGWLALPAKLGLVLAFAVLGTRVVSLASRAVRAAPLKL